MPLVTALREGRRGGVAVELDGAAWRTLPVEVASRAGLAAGLELDRPRLRALARELRRHRALDLAARELRHGDRARRELEGRLERRGVAPALREEAVETLARGGLVDDERYASARAAALADRGRGDAAIRWQLERDGVDSELAARAVAELEPERARADRIVAARGSSPATARLLARRGFSADAAEGAVGMGW